MKVQIIECVSPDTWTLRLVRESKWIKDFNANNKGLNRINLSTVTLFLLFFVFPPFFRNMLFFYPFYLLPLTIDS
jgi:hypothetical protein